MWRAVGRSTSPVRVEVARRVVRITVVAVRMDVTGWLAVTGLIGRVAVRVGAGEGDMPGSSSGLGTRAARELVPAAEQPFVEFRITDRFPGGAGGRQCRPGRGCRLQRRAERRGGRKQATELVPHLAPGCGNGLAGSGAGMSSTVPRTAAGYIGPPG